MAISGFPTKPFRTIDSSLPVEDELEYELNAKDAKSAYEVILKQNEAQSKLQHLQDILAQQNYDPAKIDKELKKARMEADAHQKADKLLRDRLMGLRGKFELRQHEMLMAHVHHDMVYVFYVFEGGKAGHFIDPIDIFPSDELVTQLRMLRAA